MSRPQVFVAGTWREVQPEHAQAARRIGVLLAEAGCDMACGPGTGVSAHAIAGFRSVADRAGVVRFYLPEQRWMDAVGEKVGEGADEIVRTDLDYPMRNAYQVSRSSGLIVVTGGDGTLEEIIPALVDYGLPVGVLRGSGPAARALELLLGVFPDWAPRTLLGDDPDEITTWVLDRLVVGG